MSRPAMLAARLDRPRRESVAPFPRPRTRGLASLAAAELVAGLIGFGVVVHLARRLGPSDFARVEYASAVAAWLLVVVRGGVEQIVQREAARRPRLIHPLTEVLLGLKCVLALAGYLLVLAVAMTSGPERGGVIAVAGLILLPSALSPDVAARVRGCLGWVSAAQILRAAAYALAVWSLVGGPDQAARAAWAGVLAETVATLVFLILHGRSFGMPRPRYRRRAWLALCRRGAIASLGRFARVGLYGADLLALGWWAGAELGPYAAARRVVFAMAAVGLVVPTAIAPSVARAWAEGASEARKAVGSIYTTLLTLAIPATIGLMMTSDRWMPILFGPEYRDGGPWLALVAARLPWLLAAGAAQAVLVACRRERESLGLVLGMSALGLAILPCSAIWAGPRGAGLAALAIEAAGATAGWLLLRRLDVAPRWTRQASSCLLACVALVGTVSLLNSAPLWVVCPSGALAFATTLIACRPRAWSTVGGNL